MDSVMMFEGKQVKTKSVKFHCKRANGTLRAYFSSEAEAVAFEADPTNIAYHGDVAHLCDK